MTSREHSNERTALDEIVFILRRLEPSERLRVWTRIEEAVDAGNVALLAVATGITRHNSEGLDAGIAVLADRSRPL